MIIITVFISQDKPRNDPYLCFCLFFLTGALVYKAYTGFGGVAKKIFDNRLIQYGGKISYGIYLFHKIIPTLVQSLFKWLRLSPPSHAFVFIFSLVLTFLIAHLSWILVEKRMTMLKEKFDL